MALYPTPGFSSIATSIGSGAGSAHFAENGREFAVIGTTFYQITQGGELLNRGTVARNSNPATISANGETVGQIFITSGGNGYIYNVSTTTFSQIAALNNLATMGAYIDGYFLALDSESSTVYMSDLFDGLTWDPTQYFERSAASDPWVSMKVANRYIYLFGQETSEVWYNEGSGAVPFLLHPSGLIQYGCAAPFSPEVVGDGIAWLSRTRNGTGGVNKIIGFTVQSITNPAIETAFAAHTISRAVGDTYEEFGHTFYLLTFPYDRDTWVYDDLTAMWHQRGTWISENGQFDVMRAYYHAFAFGEHRMLDIQGRNVYVMSTDYGTDVEDREIRRVRRAPAVFDENKRIPIASFELNMETGIGLQSGQGSDPHVMMRYSNDGGKTWGLEQWRTAGAVGNYGTRVKWNRCGIARRRVFEVAVSDPVPWRLLGAFIEPSPAADMKGAA